MKLKRYTGVSVEELIQDTGFISLVSELDENEWKSELAKYSGDVQAAFREARDMVLLFGAGEPDGEMPRAMKRQLWNRIISDYQREKSLRADGYRIRKYISVAAMLVVVLSLGVFWYLNNSADEATYRFSSAESWMYADKPVLFLSKGKQVELEGERKEIVVLEKENALRLGGDSIVKNVVPRGQKGGQVVLNEVTVPYGSQTKLVLSDGSKVWLNAGSRLAFAQEFTGDSRTVFLEGEGYFEVAEDKEKPFYVKTSSVVIKVLGTKFNVSAYSEDDKVETALLEGRVGVRSLKGIINQNVTIEPGHRAIYYKAGKKMQVKEEVNMAPFISWREGWYQFSNEKIANVLAKLERFYNVKIIFNEEDIDQALPISGKLNMYNSIDTVLTTLSIVAGIEYQILDDHILVNDRYSGE
ncbi:FecR family protein [Thermophagus sp. OGC60D27]|uniref:FecR family protein n=1 Tax=Thermophagus sp. OGC60D27 TaxID=3458415 RepID=UPI0040382C49